MTALLRKAVSTDADKAIIIIRLMVGAVFLSEGLQKFIHPTMRGPGRFESTGFPNPEFWGTFVGGFEVVTGILILIGLGTRIGASITLTIVLVAIVVPKLPLLFAESFGPFQLQELSTYGFWSMAHEMRTDFAMFLGSLFLFFKGGGKWSWDLKFFSN